MKDKVVLCFGGGAMRGVFGAGIVTTLQKRKVYDKIESVYGSSAGAINAAYFLTRQSELGSTIYWEDLPNGFIKPSNVFSGTFQRFWNRYFGQIPREKMANPVDINYLFDIMQNEKILDVNAISQESIPLFVHVFNLKRGVDEFLDARESPLSILKAGVSVIPYYFPNQQNYVDGGIAGAVGIRQIVERHPNNRVVVALNYEPSFAGGRAIKNTLEGVVASFMYPKLPMLALFQNKDRELKKDIAILNGGDRHLLVSSPEANRTKANTIDTVILLETYQMGKKVGEEIATFIQ